MASNAPSGGILSHKVGGIPIVAIGGVGIVALYILSRRGVAASTGGNAASAVTGASPSMAYNAPTLIPAGAGATSGSGGYTGSPQFTETLSNLFGGKSLNDVISGLGPNYTGFSATEGNVNVSVAHDDAAGNLALLQQQGVNDVNSIGATGLWQNTIGATAGYWANVLAGHQGTVLNPGQSYVGNGQQYINPNFNSQSQPPSTPMPTMGGNPTPVTLTVTAPSGNFSFIRSVCSTGDYACAKRVAPWLGNNKVW
jgi:hypothetical protein